MAIDLKGKRITGAATCGACGYTQVLIDDEGHCGYCAEAYIRMQIEQGEADFQSMYTWDERDAIAQRNYVEEFVPGPEEKSLIIVKQFIQDVA
jgi:hypothetical protein